MNVLVFLAHPNRDSFNHAIARRVVSTLKYNGHGALFHDLYAEKFDPLLTHQEITGRTPLDKKIRIYCDELSESDGLVFVHPNWWGQPPAILTGWIDRVLRPGVAYKFEEGDGGGGIPRGLLSGKIAVVFNTTDTPNKREIEFFGDPLDKLWKQCIFEFCGIRNHHRQTFGVIATSTFEQRRQWLAETEETTGRCFPA